MQFHENIRLEDPDRFFAPGGAHEAVLAAKKAGKIRFIGFTGHKDPSRASAHARTGGAEPFPFRFRPDAAELLDAHFRSFEHSGSEAGQRGIAVLGMKPMACGEIPRSRRR